MPYRIARICPGTFENFELKLADGDEITGADLALVLETNPDAPLLLKDRDPLAHVGWSAIQSFQKNGNLIIGIDRVNFRSARRITWPPRPCTFETFINGSIKWVAQRFYVDPHAIPRGGNTRLPRPVLGVKS